MSYHDSSPNFTSSHFEQAAIERYRSLVVFLPHTCHIFREPWDCSTVICLDFTDCPYALKIAKLYSVELARAASQLGLGNSVIFRVGAKLIGSIRSNP